MSRRILAAAAFLAASTACQRNLDLPPPPSTVALSASPAFVALAPRETTTIAGLGGAGGYTFAFAQGGRLSGTDATIGATTGLYRAGSDGSAVDVVVVKDAAGRTATASISVGPRLVVTPVSPSVTPGGKVTFVGSGGKAPYGYAFTVAGNGSAGTIAADGTYTAGPTGPSTDVIQVTDFVGAVVTTSVSVGQALRIYRSETRAVAPHESVAFVALGGKPGYTFSLVTPAGSGTGARIDASTGVYTAGDRLGATDPGTGTVSDVIRVTDSADVPQSATYTVVVGPRLALSLSATEIHPGEATQLVASGGKAPYTFGFTPRVAPTVRDATRVAGGNGGNRSGGSVDAISGTYRPGNSPGAVDFLQLTDATGAPAAIVKGPPVGGTQLAIGSGVTGCVGMNLDGDASGDVAFFGQAGGGSGSQNWGKITTATRLATAAPVVQPYYLTNWAQKVGAYAAGDFAGAGRDQLVAMGGNYWAGTNWANRDVWQVVPDLGGNLSVAQLFGGPVTASNPSGSINSSIGAAWLDRTAATWRFYATGGTPTGCPPGAPNVDGSVVRFDWAPGTTTPSSPSALTCMRVQSWCPFCGTNYYNAVAFAVGDFGGDANLDVAWIVSTVNDGQTAAGANAKVSLALGNGTTTFPLPTTGWPAGHSFYAQWNQAGQPQFVVARAPAGALTKKDALIVRLLDPAGRPKLFVLRDPSVAAVWSAGWDPNPAGGGVDGVVPLAPSAAAPGTVTSFVAYGATDGTITGFDLDWTSDPPRFVNAKPIAAFPFTVNAVCMSDVNTDGTPDLVAASDWGATAGVVLGDGTGGAGTSGLYGKRTHLHGIEFPVAGGDLDGDGFGDAVVALPGRGLAVMWGGGGQLAWGPEITNAAVGAAVVGDFTGGTPARQSVFYQEKAGAFGLVTFDGGGSDAYTAPLQLPGSDANNLPASAYFLLWPADLGTALPGSDALTVSSGDNSWVAALLHQATATAPGRRVVDVHAPAFPLPTLHANQDTWPAAVGTGKPSVAAIVPLRRKANGDPVDSVALYGATIAYPDGAPGSATPPAFSAWTQLSPTLTTDASGNITTPVPNWAPAGVTRASGALGGTVPAGWPGAGNAVFAFNTDRLYVVEVRLTTTAPNSWAWVVYPVTDALGAPVQSAGFLGMIGKLDATSDFHLVLWGSDGTTVLKRTTVGGTTSWTLVQKLSTPLFPIGIAPLAAGSPGDVIGFVGNFWGMGVTPELVPLLNDNSGRLQ